MQNKKLVTGTNFITKNDEKIPGLSRANPFDESMQLFYWTDQQELEKKTDKKLQL